MNNKEWTGKIKYFSLEDDFEQIYRADSQTDSDQSEKSENEEEKLKLKFEGEFINGKSNRIGKEYDKNGNLIFEGLWYGGYQTKGVRYYYSEEGKFNLEVEAEIDDQYARKFKVYSRFIDNLIEFEGEVLYQNESYHKWNGKIKSFNEKRQIIEEGEYKNGKFTGIKRRENEKGELIEEEYKNGDYVLKDIDKNKEKKIEIKDDSDNDNKYKYEGEYLNGKKHGKGKIYYEGKLLYEGDFLNGKKSGRGKEYNYDLSLYKLCLTYEGEFWGGKKNGIGKQYNKKGEVIFEGEFLDDIMWNGYGIKAIDYSKEIYEGFFKNNQKHGKGKAFIEYNNKKIILFEGEYLYDLQKKGKEFYKNGQIKYEGEYLMGNKYKGKEFNEEGKLLFEGEYFGSQQKWNGIINIYGKNNKVINDDNTSSGSSSCSGRSDNDSFVSGRGSCISDKENNNELLFEGVYLNGEKHGKFKNYKNKQLIFEGNYLYNEKNGKGKLYNEFGKIIYEGEYLFNKKWKGKEYIYFSDRKDILKAEYEIFNKKRNGKAIKYFKNGKIKFEGEYLNDRKWNGKRYDPFGEIVYEIKNGNKEEKQ